MAIFSGCVVVTHWLLRDFFLSQFGDLESLVLSFLFEHINWSFH